ncbi:MAG: phage terminase small subunit P27 family [Gemmataceae bacterium]
MARSGRPNKATGKGSTIGDSMKIPACPEQLTDIAKKEWKRLAPELESKGGFRATDVGALAGYCQAYADFLNATQIVKDEGMYITTARGVTVEHPANRSKNAALDRMNKFASVLGLDPHARTRLKLKPDAKAKDPTLERKL